MTSNTMKDIKLRRLERGRTFQQVLNSDVFGGTAVEYAVKAGLTETLDTFIERCDTVEEKSAVIRHALLTAIQQGNLNLVEHLLNRKAILGATVSQPHSESARSRSYSDHDISTTRSLFEHAEHTDDITPLLLAAQLQQHKIISLLFQKDEHDIHPLTVIPERCKQQPDVCFLCGSKQEFYMENFWRFVTVYRALSSPAYICQAAPDDPILEAFHISERLERRIKQHAAMKEYKELSQQCQTFAVEMLQLCRNKEEVETLLDGPISPHHKDYTHKLPRLNLAIQYKQKEFVVHPYSQQILQGYWYKGLPEWVKYSHYYNPVLAAYIMLRVLLLPGLAVLYMLRMPCIDAYMKPGFSRFINNTISYFVFLIFLVIYSITKDPIQYGEMLNIKDYILYIWILGKTIHIVKTIYRRRKSSLPRSYQLVYESFMVLFFWLALGFQIAGIIHAYSVDEVGLERHFWCNMWDPHLLAEICWVVGVILAVLRINFLFKVNSSYGPLQVSLIKMVTHVARFGVIFFIILLAFGLGISILYKAYEGNERLVPKDNRYQSDNFISFRNSLKTLIWALFGDTHPDYADVVVDNRFNSTNVSCIPPGTLVKHKVTESMGYILYLLYHVIVIIVLLNMLIAILSSSHAEIEKNAETEWKFARTQLWMIHFKQTGCLPSPFNVLPLRKLIKHICQTKVSCSGRHHSETRRNCLCQKCRRTRKDVLAATKLENYKNLMKRLSKRYWKKRQPQNQQIEQLKELPLKTLSHI